MYALIAALSIPSLFLCSAPVPKEPGTPRYFPIQKGAKWVFKTPGSKDTRVITEVKNNKGEFTVVIIDDNDGKLSPVETILVTDKGLFRAAYADDMKFDPPICILKTPVKAGEKWETSTTFSLFSLKTKFTILDLEWVEVPAGRFKAVPVMREEILTLQGEKESKKMTIIEWYAPNVGLVKRLIKGTSEDFVTVLESFTPGTPDKK
jgi:hypothetical protein